jgi:hypothetical protein
MKKFDVRYECNDARDDQFAQMRKKLKEARAGGNNLWPSGFLSHKDKFAEDLNDFDYGSDDGMQDNDGDVEKGSRMLQMLAEARDIGNIMQSSGWLNTSVGGLPDVYKERLMPSFRPRMEWINIVKHQRAELTANKLSNLPPVFNQKNKTDCIQRHKHSPTRLLQSTV